MRRFDVNAWLFKHTVQTKPLGRFRTRKRSTARPDLLLKRAQLQKPPHKRSPIVISKAIFRLFANYSQQSNLSIVCQLKAMATAAPLLVKHSTLACIEWSCISQVEVSMGEVLGTGISFLVLEGSIEPIATIHQNLKFLHGFSESGRLLYYSLVSLYRRML